MFFWVRTQSASTGLVESQFQFHCPQCGAATQATVHSMGFGQSVAPFGVGASAQNAVNAAGMNARNSASTAMQHVLCLQCGAPHPSVAAKYEAIEAADEKKSERRLKFATAGAVLVGLAGAYPAISDIHESVTLAIAVGAAALAVFGVLYGLLGWPTQRPQASVARVWLWWTQPDGTPGWVFAPTFFPPPHTDLRSVLPKALFGGALAGCAALVAGLVWWSTFEPVFVVEAKSFGASVVRIDGVPVPKSELSTLGYKDADVQMHRVRKGKDHHIELVGSDGSVLYETTLTKNETSGWVVAPGAAQAGICFGEAEVVYGSGSRTPEGGPLGKGQAAFALPRSYSDEFRAPPETQEVKSGESTTRWTLRAYRCESE